MAASSQRITTTYSPQVAKAMPILRGIRLAIDSSLAPVVVESDVAIVVKWINGGLLQDLKGAWKDIRTLEWKWKRDGTLVPSKMFLDGTIIFDVSESFNGRLMQRLDDSLILQSLEVVGLSKTKTVIQRLKEEKAEGSTDCSICLESVGVGEIVARMPCSHLFHTRCITRWLHKKPSCPLCRAPAC
ncbi:hypothetical protein EZV62_014729 [Acer yangbiense]|uniref:RING-type domain-containing protein n=1 Tax=Acer yangbiense TaxID=1000413 RepID=A0A5C7HV56_9ROSI|nr:hypothetical protein EZV62_014729 [Acer yangbiense]